MNFEGTPNLGYPQSAYYPIEMREEKWREEIVKIK